MLTNCTPAQSQAETRKSAKSNFGTWGWFTVFFSFFSFMFAGNLIIDSLNITVTAFSALHGWESSILLSYSTLAGLVAIAGCGILSQCVNRFGVKLVYLFSLLIVAVCCFLWGAVTEIWEYVAILVLVNIFGNGFGFVGGTAIIANWFPKKKGLAMGWATIGFQASAVLLLPVFQFLLDSFDLKTAYRFIGVCLFALALICAVFVKSHPEERGCAPDNDNSHSPEEYLRLHTEAMEYAKSSPFTVGKLLKTRQMWQIGIINGLIQLAVTALIAQFIPHMVTCGISESNALTIYAAAAVLGGVGSYLWGVLDYRIGVKKATVWMCVMHAAAGIAFALTESGICTSRGFLYFSALLVAAILGVSSNFLGSFTATVFGRYDYARAFSVIYMLVCGLRALSFVTVGGLAAVTGNYTASYIATAVLSVIALLVTLRTDDRCIGRLY